MNSQPFSSEQQADVTVVMLHRDALDPQVIEDFYQAMLKVIRTGPEGGKLLIDLSMMEYMPSRFLGVLLDLHKAAEQRKSRLRLAGIRPNPLGVFKLMRLDMILKLDPDRNASLAAFK